ncbi:MAG: PglZ domain-containing protein [Anaerolineae bacterium]
MLPTTVKDFVRAKLAELPLAARLVVVFDPYADLDLGERFEVEASDLESPMRTWRVLRYDGNDLAFRQGPGRHPSHSDLIWVTAPPGEKRGEGTQIKLRSLMDVWCRAEAFIDASLPGVLRQLEPKETWPEGPVWEQAGILGQNLKTVISGWKKLRRWLGRPPSLAIDAHIIRALTLHCLQPDLPIDRFLFRVDTPTRLLDVYLDLLWRAEWPPQGLALLQEQAREAPRLNLGEVEAWLSIPATTIALYLYLRRFLGRFRIPNVANQLRGLGLLEVDTAALETQVGSMLDRWDRDPTWRNRVIRQAEETLTLDDINRVIELLNLDTPTAAFEALARADTPATIYALQLEFFQRALGTRQAHNFTPAWTERRPIAVDDLPESPFKARVLTLAMILDETAFIDARLPLSPPGRADIPRLLDWYVERELYDLEYAHARAGSHLLYLADEKLRRQVKSYLEWQQKLIQEFLDNLDHTLAELITQDWPGYLSHPRLSINILSDTVKRRRLQATTQARLWVVVFDGMRWDTWARHVKPRLLETFELVEPEKSYLSLLPSWTMVARTGLLAGRLPGDWQSYGHRFTRDQAQLAARLFSIPQREQRRQLLFFSSMESDRKYSQMDNDTRYPYNVLVYNISDDNLHSQQGNLAELNKTVNTLLDNILQVLNNLIEPDDTLIVASDHGFVELDQNSAVIIHDDRRWERYRAGAAHPIRYRYLTTHEIPASLSDVHKVEYRGLRDQYTVAIGRRWFKRADSRGREARYAHGGLSLAEMTVPGAILKRITAKRMKPVLSARPAKLKMQEKETKELILSVANKGNAPLTGQLAVQADTAAEPATYSIALSPGEEHQVVYNVIAYYHTRSDKTVVSTQQVRVTFSYTNLAGEEEKRRKHVSVTVSPRTDVVELDFGGLPDIDI